MKRNLRLLPTLGVLVLLATAVTDAQEKQGDAKPNYYPLQVGNQWSFKVTVGENSTPAISKVAKLEKFDEIELARLEATVNGVVIATEHLRQTEQGVFRHRNMVAEITPPICLLKYPITIKPKEPMKWSGDIKVGNDKGKYTCEAVEESIEVPAGKYKAIKVSIRLDNKGQSVNTNYWFVQDIGFVKQTVDAVGLSIVMEMDKFERAK